MAEEQPLARLREAAGGSADAGGGQQHGDGSSVPCGKGGAGGEGEASGENTSPLETYQQRVSTAKLLQQGDWVIDPICFSRLLADVFLVRSVVKGVVGGMTRQFIWSGMAARNE